MASPKAKSNKKKNTRDIGWEDVDGKKFIAYGSVFSLAFDGTLYPADVVKTRLQVQGGVVCTQA